MNRKQFTILTFQDRIEYPPWTGKTLILVLLARSIFNQPHIYIVHTIN